MSFELFLLLNLWKDTDGETGGKLNFNAHYTIRHASRKQNITFGYFELADIIRGLGAFFGHVYGPLVIYVSTGVFTASCLFRVTSGGCFGW